MKHRSKFFGDNIIIILFAVLVVVAVVNVAILAGMSSRQTTYAAPAPAKLDAVEITVPCSQCYNVSKIIGSLQNVNMTQRQVSFSSPEALTLIQKYQIKNLPAIVVTGEINKTQQLAGFWPQTGAIRNGAAVIEPQVPYYSISKGRIVGLVNVTRIVNSGCTECVPIDSVVSSFKQMGVAIVNDISIDYSSPEGKDLVSVYNVQAVPAIIVSKDILEYAAVAQVWPQLNATEKNGNYALHIKQAPYFDVAMNRTVGLVDVIFLNDSSCESCYNVLVHKQILSGGFGIKIMNSTFVDVNSAQGKSLTSMYKIKFVPMFVMSPDAKYYPALMNIWPQVGTNETNGWYVFRNMSQLGPVTYKNIETNTLIASNKTSSP